MQWVGVKPNHVTNKVKLMFLMSLLAPVTCMVCVRKWRLLSPRQVCRLSSLCHLSSVIPSRDIFNVIVHKHSRSILPQCQAQVDVSGVIEHATFCSPGCLWWWSYVPLVFVVTQCFGLVHLVATHSMAPTCVMKNSAYSGCTLAVFPLERAQYVADS